MNAFYVYQLRLEGAATPFYVGKGRGRRAWSHSSPRALTANTRKANTIMKAIREGTAVLVEVIDTDLAERDALASEMALIASYGRLHIGTGCLTNMTDGGEGATGYKHTDSTLAKMAEISVGRCVTDEARAKISLALKGRERTKKHCENISLAKAGKAPGPEVAKAASEYHKGRAKSADHKAKIGEANRGRLRSEETKNKMAKANKLKPLLSCPHCPVVTKPSAFTRYHGDNCRFKS